MVLLLPNNSLQDEDVDSTTDEDTDSTNVVRAKRSADAKLASELDAPSMLGELHS